MSSASVGFHCPECTRTGKQKVYTRANWSDAIHRPLVARVLIAINVAVFVAGLAAQSNNAVAGRGGFALDGGLFGPAVADGEWWRIVTAGFLHAGLLHLGFNMLALWNLSSLLEADARAGAGSSPCTSCRCSPGRSACCCSSPERR